MNENHAFEVAMVALYASIVLLLLSATVIR